MKIKQIRIKGFKTLNDVVFTPGRINVFVGANGSGKTTLLEAIGILSAAMTDRVDHNALNRKGIRLSVPELYQSSFKDLARRSSTIGFNIAWQQADDEYEYSVNLNVPSENDNARKDMWRYHSEALLQNGKKLWGRSGASQASYDPYVGFFMLDQDKELLKVRSVVDAFRTYGIFQPNTPTLRGTQGDPYQSNPIGLCGGRLAEAIEEILCENVDGDMLIGDMPLDELIELIDWIDDFNVAAPKKTSINSAVPTTRRLLEFTDRYMRSSAHFTAYDASEGALYVLFLMALALHPDAPSVFAVDSFDHAMHPRLARAATRLFSNVMLQKGKTAFITTHNPLVLDGLDLQNDDIRLFAVDKNRINGHTTLNRIQITPDLLDSGYSLSRLWLEGRLGGVPNLL
ncbi:MAG: AAA family ATPase [Clostridia bacterium]